MPKTKTESNAELTKDIKKLERKVKKLVVAEEIKQLDIAPATFDADDSPTGGIVILNGIPNGTLGSYQRVGRSVRMKHIHIEGDAQVGNALFPIMFRVALVRSKLPLGVALANQQLVFATFESTTVTQTYSPIYNFKNSNLEDAYEVLWHKWYTRAEKNEYFNVVTGLPVGTLYPERVKFIIDQKLNFTTEWSETATAVNAVPQSNALYLLVSSNVPSGGTAGDKPDITYRSRVTFVDS